MPLPLVSPCLRVAHSLLVDHSDRPTQGYEAYFERLRICPHDFFGCYHHCAALHHFSTLISRGLGARALNVDLQHALNPPVDEVCIERFGVTYRVGDKVMQTDNDYDKDVFNGDVGYVRRIDPDAQELVIEFDDKPVAYQFGELDEVALAYAVSIHKSQGSEYPAVVIPMMMQHYMMLRRNLLYTGITRGRKLVVLVGQKQAIGMAAKGKIETRRWSKLAEWMA